MKNNNLPILCEVTIGFNTEVPLGLRKAQLEKALMRVLADEHFNPAYVTVTGGGAE